VHSQTDTQSQKLEVYYQLKKFARKNDDLKKANILYLLKCLLTAKIKSNSNETKLSQFFLIYDFEETNFSDLVCIRSKVDGLELAL